MNESEQRLHDEGVNTLGKEAEERAENLMCKRSSRCVRELCKA